MSDKTSVVVGDRIVLGSYAQDGQFCEAKPIEWRVLAVEDGKALVISEYGLDCKPYHSSHADVTWACCDLRGWLNGEFLDDAFDPSERAMIAEMTVRNPDNPKYESPGGSDTRDKVFLLSIDEAYCYFASDSERACRPTSYAFSNGVAINDSGACFWWLRSPGCSASWAAVVSNINGNGTVNSLGCSVDFDYFAVRPAMWVNLQAFQHCAAI